MGLFCGNCFLRRIIACLIIFIGVILLLCFTPFWVWLAIIGAFLVCMGCFILLRKF